jgi:hypothetical protein
VNRDNPGEELSSRARGGEKIGGLNGGETNATVQLTLSFGIFFFCKGSIDYRH